jgi:hypothetical protein
VTEDTATKWAARLDARAEIDWQVAEDLTKKVRVWVAMPPIARTQLADGKTLVEPVGIKETKDVATIAQAASQMAYAAIAQALPDAHVDLDPRTATIAELEDAIKRLEAAMAPVQPRLARLPL